MPIHSESIFISSMHIIYTETKPFLLIITCRPQTFQIFKLDPNWVADLLLEGLYTVN